MLLVEPAAAAGDEGGPDPRVGRVVHRLDAGRAQRPPVGAARASEAVALWAFRGSPIASRNSATLTLAHRRYSLEYFSDLFCMTCTPGPTRFGFVGHSAL